VARGATGGGFRVVAVAAIATQENLMSFEEKAGEEKKQK
jgi:hypothetical protein